MSSHTSPVNGAIWVLLLSGILGFRVGMLGFPDWQVAVETAQVVAGLVSLSARQHFLHLSHAVVDGAAPDPRGGARLRRQRDHALAGRQRRAGHVDVSGAGAVRVRAEPGRASLNRRRRADFLHTLRRVRRRLSPFPARHRTHLWRDRPFDRRAHRGVARRGLVSHGRILPRHRAVHSSGAWLVDRRDRRACRAFGLPPAARRASPGAAVVSCGLWCHARQPDDPIRPLAGHRRRDDAAVSQRFLGVHQAVGRSSRRRQYLAQRRAPERRVASRRLGVDRVVFRRHHGGRPPAAANHCREFAAGACDDPALVDSTGSAAGAPSRPDARPISQLRRDDLRRAAHRAAR